MMPMKTPQSDVRAMPSWRNQLSAAGVVLVLGSFWAWHGPACDESFQRVLPYVGQNVRVTVSDEQPILVGEVKGLSETPEHVMRLFVGDGVVSYDAGQEIQIDSLELVE
jgi:hypothetical protein